MNETSDAEMDRLKQQVERGDFSEFRRFLAETQRTRGWQDRCFLLLQLAPFFYPEALCAASDAEPQAADLLLMLGTYYFHRVRDSRGGKQAEQTTDEQFEAASMQIQNMMGCFVRVYPLEPGDPTPHVFAMRGLVVFSEYQEDVRQEYTEAIRLAPDCVPAHLAMINARAQKWGGSHDEALQIARTALRSGRLGSDLPVCLFLAHFLVWQYARQFDKNKAEADRYVKDPVVTRELNQTLDRWISSGYLVRRSSIPYLHQAALWYYLAGDSGRLRQIFALTGKAPCDLVWKQIGDPAKTHSSALQRIAPAVPSMALPPVKKTGLLGWLKK